MLPYIGTGMTRNLLLPQTRDTTGRHAVNVTNRCRHGRSAIGRIRTSSAECGGVRTCVNVSRISVLSLCWDSTPGCVKVVRGCSQMTSAFFGSITPLVGYVISSSSFGLPLGASNIKLMMSSSMGRFEQKKTSILEYNLFPSELVSFADNIAQYLYNQPKSCPVEPSKTFLDGFPWILGIIGFFLITLSPFRHLLSSFWLRKQPNKS